MNQTAAGLLLGLVCPQGAFHEVGNRGRPVLGLLFAFLTAAAHSVNGAHPYLQIMLPGFVVGAIVGFLMQRWGRLRRHDRESSCSTP